MWCLISQPDSTIFEVKVDPKAIGQECLEKVCEHLSISNECDYFGLKFENSKGEEMWLNLRNPIDRQVNTHGHTTPLRFALRVKFWVPPHLLLQEKTRHQFYLHARLELNEGRLLPTNWECVTKLVALIAQADSGDYDPMCTPNNLYLLATNVTTVAETSTPNEDDDEDTEGERPHDLLQRIVAEHKSYAGMKPSTAEYWLLKEVSTLNSFGEEMFHARSTKSPNHNVRMGVGPHGISVYRDNVEKQIIPFTAIQSASSQRRLFKLEYLAVDNVLAHLETKLDTSHAASGLYRAITEKHAFYSCETVRTAVTSQFIRDLKGTIASIFNEGSSLGKKYVFDIRRTCREVYDNARRALYQETQVLRANMMEMERRSSFDGEQSKNSHERLAKILDAMLCRICMDSQIDTAFLPCAHVVACSSCASKCDRCPLCRADIVQAQKIYLPGEFQQTVTI